MLRLERILVGTDFSSCSEVAVEAALELASGLGAGLTVLHALEVPSYIYMAEGYSAVDLRTELEEDAMTRMREVVGRARARMPDARGVVRAGEAAWALLSVAEEEESDLIVVGTHGRTGASRLLLGSVAERVVRNARCSVWTVRSPRASAHAGRHV